MAGAPVKLKGRGIPMASSKDVNKDGFRDLIVHFQTNALELGAGDTEAVLEGATFDGLPIQGSDTVRVVSK